MKGSETETNGPGATIPLVIGISGHRDLREQDIAALEGAVDRLFEDLSKRFPNTPITLVSQLAEGADRLVARVAQKRGATIVVLLPMPRELYETDFKTDASQKEFATMLGSASSVTELPLPEGISVSDVAPEGDTRDSRYAAAGVEVNRMVHLLIALWDGEPAVGPGGTGQIVQFMLQGPSAELREVDDFLHFSRVGPVVHIWTPRKRGTGTSKPAGQVEWLGPATPQWKDSQAALHHQIEQIERFNADALEAEDADSNSLLPPSARCDAAESEECTRVGSIYRMADRLARDFQSRARRAYISTSLAGMAVLSFYELNVHYHTHRTLFLVLFLICMALSAGLFFLVWKPVTHERFLDYRALAEALRVQYFWSLAGTGTRVIEHLAPRLREELEWLRLALLSCGGGIGAAADGTSSQALQCVQEHWVRDQKAYFQKRSEVQQTKVEINSAYKTAFAVTGLLLLLMTIVLQGSHEPQTAISVRESMVAALFVVMLGLGAFTVVFGIKRLRVLERHRLFVWTFVGIGSALVVVNLILIFRSEYAVRSGAFLTSAILSVLCAVAAGVLELYGEHFAFKEHARRYRTMADLFARADEALDPLLARSDLPEAQRLIVELGRESLAENAEWFAMHRERPIKLLKPG